MSTTIGLIRGDHHTISVAVTDPDASATDLTGGTLWWYVKASSADLDVSAVIAKESGGGGITIDGGTGGTATIAILPADTSALASTYLDALLEWELQFKDSSGTISTVARGNCVITSDLVITTT